MAVPFIGDAATLPGASKHFVQRRGYTGGVRANQFIGAGGNSLGALSAIA